MNVELNCFELRELLQACAFYGANIQNLYFLPDMKHSFKWFYKRYFLKTSVPKRNTRLKNKIENNST